ncbi:MAG: hypothetical protein A4C66_09785 [Nitrospira sp. HN-bin3]|uniref:DUF2442 domain-containing protein n=1 Tax=Nitrospira cf. moscoviensis SBR1015 TaxID=96242 RepID=UPI000A0B0551|nr:DUF2442 domain-containing protein [Nitrospira cf. moscoviensis SBR1015]OQW41770.1 MAG: hypothetical protein A4C66_09785 [Nitrospira sp. HN-bin3]
MKPVIRNKTLLRVDVTHISTYGLWLLTDNSELFVPFMDFPQLRTASLSILKHVVQLRSNRLYWPGLNIEIPVKLVRCFPLVSVKPRPTKRSGQQAKT